MFQDDLRGRIGSYDRMRQDKEKMKKLATKSRSLKKRARSASNFHKGEFLSSSFHDYDNRLSMKRFYDSATDNEIIIPGAYSSNTMRQLLTGGSMSRAQSATTLNLSTSTPLLLSPGWKSTTHFGSTTDLSVGNPSMKSSTVLNRSISHPHETFAAHSHAPSHLTRSTSFPENLTNASLLNNMKQTLPNSFNSSVATGSMSVPNHGSEAVNFNGNDFQTVHALSMYYQQFNGLQSYGVSGMTVLEEMIDAGLRICENSRKTSKCQHARSAVLLSSAGKIYVGCDAKIPNLDNGGGTTAEKTAFLSAVADGSNSFEGLVICSDTMKSFPVPDGTSRELIRSFGNFPIILTNCDLEIRNTTAEELFPVQNMSQMPVASDGIATMHDAANDEQVLIPRSLSEDVRLWNLEDVGRWLRLSGYDNLVDSFANLKVDGILLLRIDEEFILKMIPYDLKSAFKRRKFLHLLQQLLDYMTKFEKDTKLDEVDEYILTIESKRIQLVAKLKALFDRFDEDRIGRLNAMQIERLLHYMNRPTNLNKVQTWLLQMAKDNQQLDFAGFVNKYTLIYTEDGSTFRDDTISAADGIRDGDKKHSEEQWYDAELSDDEPRNAKESNSLKFDDILDVKMLAELKSIFDRFAVDDLITAPETCQALTESGLVVPRREIAQYLRGRKHVGLKRNIDYFEFIRAFAALR